MQNITLQSNKFNDSMIGKTQNKISLNLFVNAPYVNLIKPPTIINTTAVEPFERDFIDVIRPLTRTPEENFYIRVLTMQCDLSKFLIAKLMLNKT